MLTNTGASNTQRTTAVGHKMQDARARTPAPAEYDTLSDIRKQDKHTVATLSSRSIQHLVPNVTSTIHDSAVRMLKCSDAAIEHSTAVMYISSTTICIISKYPMRVMVDLPISLPVWWHHLSVTDFVRDVTLHTVKHHQGQARWSMSCRSKPTQRNRGFPSCRAEPHSRLSPSAR